MDLCIDGTQLKPDEQYCDSNSHLSFVWIAFVCINPLIVNDVLENRPWITAIAPVVTIGN